jgi:putative tryptophan/tyrosine transport system substrate-binding protein
MDRRAFMGAAVGGFIAAPFAAIAQAPAKVARMGYLALSPREALPGAVATMLTRLAELGYHEGQNLIFEFRNADTQDRLRELAAELLAIGVRVIFARGQDAIRATRAATTTLPIVGLDNEIDPVAAGYAASLARPGGNLTGIFLDQPEVSAKQLQLLKEMMPTLSRVAVLWDPAVATAQREAVEVAGSRLSVKIAPIAWRGSDAVAAALRTASQAGAQGLIVLSTPRILDPRYRPIVAEAALKARLPAIGLTVLFAKDGLLMAYGPVQRDMDRSAAALVAKVLDGARPADLPIERPVHFALTINQRTANALGIKIPQALLLRADEVIQ